MRISQRSIEQVRETADIAEVASEFTALRRQGQSYTGLCPYPDHSEKTPSFSVTPDKGFYYCFGCGKGGDAIKLVTDLRDLPFVEAVTYLAERSGIELEFEGSSPADSQAARQKSEKRRATYRTLAAATAYYHKYLLKSQSSEAADAREYLKRRGLLPSTLEEFRVGLSPSQGSSGFTGAAHKLKLDRTTLNAAGLLSPRGGDRFFGRITFPISDRRGRIVGFGARAMGDAQPKYLNSPESEIFNKRDLLYGLPQVLEPIRKERAALVVEGYTDVLMLYQAGIKNAVATLGTATTPGHLKSLSSYADKVYVLFDPDDAGEKAIERATVTAADLKQDLRVLRLDEDPADWLLHHTAEDFKELFSKALPALEYSVWRIVEGARGTGAAARARAVPEVQRLIKQIEDPVLHNEAVRVGAEALGVSPEVFRNSGRGAVPSSAPRTKETTERTDPHSQAGWEVLALMLASPELHKKPLNAGISLPEISRTLVLTPGDFDGDNQARLFALLSDNSGQNFESIIANEEARPLMDDIGRLYAASEKAYPSGNSIRAAWLRLRILSRERDKRQSPDYDEKSKIHAEIQKLKSALNAIGEQS
ncbi:DNA primase [soil metagenome]